jgi:hypothetical protein
VYSGGGAAAKGFLSGGKDVLNEPAVALYPFEMSRAFHQRRSALSMAMEGATDAPVVTESRFPVHVVWADEIPQNGNHESRTTTGRITIVFIANPPR